MHVLLEQVGCLRRVADSDRSQDLLMPFSCVSGETIPPIAFQALCVQDTVHHVLHGNEQVIVGGSRYGSMER